MDLGKFHALQVRAAEPHPTPIWEHERIDCILGMKGMSIVDSDQKLDITDLMLSGWLRV